MNADQRARLRRDLIRDEGEKLEAYRDSVGLWTIGVGHLLGAQARMTKITERESRALLDADMDEAEGLARKTLPNWNEIDEVRQRAILNMCFNLGNRIAGFMDFLSAVEVQAWERAAVAMIDSKWALQVGERAKRLRDMVRYGQNA